MESTNDFGFLGTNGQYIIAKLLIENKDFFLKIEKSVNPNVFTDSTLQKIVKVFINRYKDSGELLSYKGIEMLIKATNPTPTELTEYKKIFDILLQKVSDSELKVAEETAEEFFKRNEVNRILDNFKASLKKGYTIDKLGKYLQELQDVEKVNLLYAPKSADELIDETLTTPSTVRVPTGVDELDRIFRGGFPKGAVSLLIAGTGVGKSTLGSIFCCNAAMNGKKVLHIFFEDLETEIAQKYYAHILNRSTFEFENLADNVEKRRELSKALHTVSENTFNFLKNNVKLFRMRNGDTTIEDIVTEVRKLETLQEWKPDMIFIDYFSCLKTTNNETIRLQNEWQAMERCMKRIEQFANSENIAILVAQQTNRNGMDEDTASKRMANIQGSYRITQPASIILYLDRTGCERNMANLYIDKARGCDVNGKTEYENIILDNGTCQIDLSGYEDNTDEVLEAFAEKEEELKDNKLKLINNGKDSKQD